MRQFDMHLQPIVLLLMWSMFIVLVENFLFWIFWYLRYFPVNRIFVWDFMMILIYDAIIPTWLLVSLVIIFRYIKETGEI